MNTRPENDSPYTLGYSRVESDALVKANVIVYEKNDVTAEQMRGRTGRMGVFITAETVSVGETLDIDL